MPSRFSAHEVTVPSDKKCKRCAGKGIGQWGMTYGECFRCGGSGVEPKVDREATMIEFAKTLARIQAEGEAAKLELETAKDVLHKGNARRDLERARRQYKEILTERARVAAHYQEKKKNG